MKKIICLILCAFLLTACSRGGVRPPENDELLPDVAIGTVDPSPTIVSSDFEERLSALEIFTPRAEIINRYHPYPTYELITGDYGKLYPFPAFATSIYDVLYGLMTADGRVVLDELFEFIWYIDIGDGYYRTHRVIPDNGWETRYIAADGSRELILPQDVFSYAMLDDETIRIFVRQGDWDEEWKDRTYTGILDMDGNIISPLINVGENYKSFSFGGAQFEDALYVNIHTGEHFVHFHGTFWVSYEGGEHIVESRVINEQEEIESILKYTDKIRRTRWFGRNGLSNKQGD